MTSEAFDTQIAPANITTPGDVTRTSLSYTIIGLSDSAGSTVGERISKTAITGFKRALDVKTGVSGGNQVLISELQHHDAEQALCAWVNERLQEGIGTHRGR